MGKDDGLPVQLLQSLLIVSEGAARRDETLIRSSVAGYMRIKAPPHSLYHENRGVSLEVDPRAGPDGLESSQRDVLLIAEAETDDEERHFDVESLSYEG